MFLNILQSPQETIFAGISFLRKLQAGNLKLPEGTTPDVQ